MWTLGWVIGVPSNFCVASNGPAVWMAQAEGYRQELEKEYGGDWTGSVETYKRKQ